MIRLDIFDHESKPLLKLLELANSNDEIMSHFDEEETEGLSTFMDCLQELVENNTKAGPPMISTKTDNL